MPVLRLGALLAGLLLAACSGGDAPRAADADADGWVGSWATAQYGPYPLGPLTGVVPFPLPDGVPLPPTTLFPGNAASNQSFRMVAHPTLGGSELRLRLSNLYGTAPVTFEPVRVALRAAGPAIVPGSDEPVLWDGAPAVTIAPGAEAISDPVALSFGAGDDLTVSFHLPGESAAITWHAVSFNLSYVGLPGTGDLTGDPTGATFAQPTLGVFYLSGVDVRAPDSPGAIVALGDSITDGAYQVPETNTRWPDWLARRLQGAGIDMGVLNQGINSNTVTRAGTPEGEEWKGPPAEERFDRDVLGRSGVRSMVLFEGTNDLSAGVSAEDVHAGLHAIAARAKAAGLCVVIGTIPPRADVVFGWDRATMEPRRQQLNALIREDGIFDAIADFDAVLAAPLDPTLPNPLYIAPDMLHPTSVGFAAMAAAVPLAALVPPPAGDCGR